MEQILKKMMDMGMGQFMDKSRQELCMSDTIYQGDNEDERELEQRYSELDLTRRQRLLVNDYVACMETARSRYADISYVAGVKDTIKMLIHIGALEEAKIFEESGSIILGIYNI
jgi:hypothetical protein